MSDVPKGSSQKDLTGIFHLEPHPSSDQSSDSSPQKETTPLEHVEAFESLDQLGMVDHPLRPTEMTPENPTPPPLFSESSEVQESPAPRIDVSLIEAPSTEADSPPVLDELRSYSEQAQSTIADTPIFYPFHLHIQGKFGPFERDKLLHFITEYPIGLSSSDLDLQLSGGRVLFSRISEYAGIKLIQELRDSGLDFSLIPSDRDQDDFMDTSPSLSYHFDRTTDLSEPLSISLPVLTAHSPAFLQYEEFDTLQGSQYLKANLVEAEKSELFQEVLDRMVESLKQKAKRKGADALVLLEQKITPLRLPSQYQVTLKASLLRKIKEI